MTWAMITPTLPLMRWYPSAIAATSPSCLPTMSFWSPSSAMAAKIPVSAEPGFVKRYSTPASFKVWRSSMPPVPVIVFRMVSLSPSLLGRSLQIVELPAHAGNHRGQVRREHDEIEAALHRACGERGARTVHARLDAVLVGRVADLVARGHVDRIGLVGAGRQAQGEGEIGGADVHGVEPGRRADRVEVVDAFLRLDHGHDHDLVVRLGHVIGA